MRGPCVDFINLTDEVTFFGFSEKGQIDFARTHTHFPIVVHVVSTHLESQKSTTAIVRSWLSISTRQHFR